MEKLYVLNIENYLVGVYTSHRKAMQAIFSHTLQDNLKLTDYVFDFGIEYFTYQSENGITVHYDLHEVTPDEQA